MVKHPKHGADWDDEPEKPEHHHHRDPLAKVVADEVVEPPALVKIRCTHYGLPFVENDKRLEFDEEVEVSQEVADGMIERELAEVVQEAKGGHRGGTPVSR